MVSTQGAGATGAVTTTGMGTPMVMPKLTPALADTAAVPTSAARMSALFFIVIFLSVYSGRFALLQGRRTSNQMVARQKRYV
jgi:hypothetical protein